MFAAFTLWTAAISFVDVKAIGPHGSTVGFAVLNGFVHNLTGVHMSLYIITDWLGFIQIGFVMGFGASGIIQWIKRKSIRNVDYSILVLGVLYAVVMVVYILFEIFVVNRRPVLIDGILETSYTLSTTMLVMCVMSTTIMQFNAQIKNNVIKRCVAFVIAAFIVFMVIKRLVSGAHWFSDIIGGALLSARLVLMHKCRLPEIIVTIITNT